MSGKSTARQQRRLRIMESASHAFAENDYAAVSMDTVARRAGVSRGTVYNYYGSKERLYREVLAQRFGQLMARLEQALARSSDPVEHLESCVVQPLEFFVRFPNLLLLWRREGVSAQVAGMQERLAGLVRGVLVSGIGSGAFRDLDPDAMSRAILGAVEGAACALGGSCFDDPGVSRAVEELRGFVRRSLLEGTARRAG
jgi:AcrR family transcriptional regulator